MSAGGVNAIYSLLNTAAVIIHVPFTLLSPSLPFSMIRLPSLSPSSFFHIPSPPSSFLHPAFSLYFPSLIPRLSNSLIPLLYLPSFFLSLFALFLNKLPSLSSFSAQYFDYTTKFLSLFLPSLSFLQAAPSICSTLPFLCTFISCFLPSFLPSYPVPSSSNPFIASFPSCILPILYLLPLHPP